ncbi:MAG: nitrite/sulfite reductase [Alphaproteobacteria bacterium]|jgi:sulfite reductase (NADPH) hemoprotein beta-component|nr:nitrite/sulfite reductase [Alphaproteobacteria bacterium]
MYRYDEFDRDFVAERVEQFRGQVGRRLSGELSEEEFRPLRLLNGLYLQLHAYMLRVVIPYGMLSSRQLRMLAQVARRYDRGYGHFTTRQNIQFNWPKLEEVPDLLADLATVEMHAIQGSGNSIRNVTADQFAGVAADEVEDPRVYAEIVRQWSTLHPEFTFLPRKFKIALTGAGHDRAAVRVHDIGLAMVEDAAGEAGFEVIVGGGLGRTPMIGKTIREFLAKRDLLSYLEAILRIYNQFGRRDNKYKARIKILVHELGAEKFTELVEAEWREIKDGTLELPAEEIERIEAYFADPPYETFEADDAGYLAMLAIDGAFRRWATSNLFPHKRPGYAIVNLSLKPLDGVPGDATAAQMEAAADLADRYGFGEIRITHEQNLVLPYVAQRDLHDLWRALDEIGFATPNIGQVTDIISCPGLDFCSLASARSIPVAQRIGRRFRDLDRQFDIGELHINISGCINACGHHHVGHIGLLGVDRKGEEYYQITLGGSADENASLGEIVGPAVSYDAVVDAIEAVIAAYLEHREPDEPFIETYRRLGAEPFKESVYGKESVHDAA